MFELSDFIDYCRAHHVDIIPYPGAPTPGATLRDQDCYAVFLDFTKIHTTRMLRGVCYHELGHAATGSLHKVDSPYELVERSEYRANRYVAERFLTETEFRRAFSRGYTELWQLSEFFDLPEADISAALAYWSERKGKNFNQKTGAY